MRLFVTRKKDIRNVILTFVLEEPLGLYVTDIWYRSGVYKFGDVRILSSMDFKLSH